MKEWYQKKELPLLGLSEAGYRQMERGDFVKHMGAMWVLTGANMEHNTVFIARYGTAKTVVPGDIFLEWDK